LTKAVVIIKPKTDDWFSRVAINYSQLNFDYSVTSRLDSEDFEYFITSKYDSEQFADYEYTLVIPAGVILGYTFFERKLQPLIEQGYTRFGNNKFYVDGEEKHYNLEYTAPFIDSDNFSRTHSSVTTLINDQSNMSYLIHNEIPQIKFLTNRPADWALTVGSGFFINHLLEATRFTENARVIHVDVSRISLDARKYTLKNWNGEDYYSWLDHVNELYPSINLFNKNKFTSKDPNTKRIINHQRDIFGSQWITHWKRYQNLDHDFHVCNISDLEQVKSILGERRHSHGIIWWDGALKRLPGNLCNTSEDSWKLAKDFTNMLSTFDPELCCYGSDHCALEFHGERAIDVSNRVREYNSREILWKNI